MENIGIVYLSDNKWWLDTIILVPETENNIKSYRVVGDPHIINKGWYKFEICTKGHLIPKQWVKLIIKII